MRLLCESFAAIYTTWHEYRMYITFNYVEWDVTIGFQTIRILKTMALQQQEV